MTNMLLVSTVSNDEHGALYLDDVDEHGQAVAVEELDEHELVLELGGRRRLHATQQHVRLDAHALQHAQQRHQALRQVRDVIVVLLEQLDELGDGRHVARERRHAPDDGQTLVELVDALNGLRRRLYKTSQQLHVHVHV